LAHYNIYYNFYSIEFYWHKGALLLIIDASNSMHEMIQDGENKRKFIEEVNGTKNKLRFAQSVNVHIRETYFLFGIIYNASLHLIEGQDISKPLGLKLENGTIKQMIKSIFD
jgi:hypothetical protein